MSSPVESVLLPGSIVAGKLRVIRQLGAGGMGAVYEVEHELTKHRRALKVLHPEVAQSPTIVGRFLREASAAARIGNPHIAETFDAGRLETGAPYLLMELLEGETLDGRVSRLGPLPPGEIAELVYQACEGIIAAHDAGIVHRDLKPENLFVTTRDGAAFVKVLDFGISKFESRRAGALGVTAEGAVMGTPFYMPPEQVRGAASIDARADVYALGVILYECSSGVRPYDAPTLEQLAILIHEGKAVPLGERRPSLSVHFCDVVHRAMAVDRDQRYRTARDLAQALAALRTPVGSARPSDPSRVVIHASSAPPPEAAGSRVASWTAPSVTATAMADTLATVPPPKGHARAWAVVAGIVACLGAALAITFTHATRISAPAAAAVAVPLDTASAPAAAPPAVLTASAAVLSAAPSVLSEIRPESRDAGARSAASVWRAPPTAGPAAPMATPSASAAPAPAKAAKSRVDQSGLAGENPFR